MPRTKQRRRGRPRISTEARSRVYNARFTWSEAKKIKAAIKASKLGTTEYLRKQILNGAKLSRIGLASCTLNGAKLSRNREIAGAGEG